MREKKFDAARLEALVDQRFGLLEISGLSGDMLVFTGGIGENDALVRAEICSGLAWIGVRLDESRNRSASSPVSDGASRCQVLVLASQEDWQIARHAWALLAPGPFRQAPASRSSHG